MVEQRRKDPGRKGRPADRGGKARRSRPQAGRSRGAALGRGRGRRDEADAHGGQRRSARPRRVRNEERNTVVPSDRWRTMRRVEAAAEGGPSGSREQPSPSEQGSVGASQQTEQTPPRHGRLGWLFRRER